MAFSFDGIIVDRIYDAIAEKMDESELLYRLVQISEGTIDTTSESKDKTDAQGNLIKRVYTTKNVNVSLTNALLDLNIIGASAGSGKQYASADNTIEMPMITFYKATTEDIVLKEVPKTVTVEDVETPVVQVYAIESNGALGKKYVAGTDASETEFAVFIADGKVTLKLPTDAAVSKYMVKYNYVATEGAVRVEQRADKFPDTIKLTLTVLGFEECAPDTLRKFYIIFPSFQPSPDSNISLTTESTLDYTGDAQVAYCSDDKLLYYIVAAEDDIEE